MGTVLREERRAQKGSIVGKLQRLSGVGGEALTTHRSGTPKVLLQFTQTHLNGRNVVFIQQVEECPAIDPQDGRRLSLGQTPLFEPL